MSFKPARLDPPALLLTGAYFCALAIAVLMAIGGVAPLLGLAAAMGGIALACALVAPREYVLEDEGITVKRTLGSLRVEGPLEVETVAARELIGVKMLLGSGGHRRYRTLRVGRLTCGCRLNHMSQLPLLNWRAAS